MGELFIYAWIRTSAATESVVSVDFVKVLQGYLV